MEAIRVHRVVEKDGEILVTGLPYKKGQSVEVILISQPPAEAGPARLTARKLHESEVIAIWEDRKDISESADFARQLRESAQRRQP